MHCTLGGPWTEAAKLALSYEKDTSPDGQEVNSTFSLNLQIIIVTWLHMPRLLNSLVIDNQCDRSVSQ